MDISDAVAKSSHNSPGKFEKKLKRNEEKRDIELLNC